jgi:hypothetical protein
MLLVLTELLVRSQVTVVVKYTFSDGSDFQNQFILIKQSKVTHASVGFAGSCFQLSLDIRSNSLHKYSL